MKINSILRFAAFTTAFVVSAAFAGLFVDQSDYQSNLIQPTADYGQANSSELQNRIWLFLDEDRANGAAFGSEAQKARTSDKLAGELTATVSLSMKMNRMDDSDLPSDLRAAWKNHVAAWDEQASFLHRVVKIRDSQVAASSALTEQYFENDAEITRTYFVLLDVAETYGVDFPR